MGFKKIMAVALMLICINQSYAQNFKADLKKLNAEIEAAYEIKKLTAVEYGKMKKEQDIIKLAMDKANVDGIFSPDEKNKIHSKIVRSRKRLAKYKTNREIY